MTTLFRSLASFPTYVFGPFALYQMPPRASVTPVFPLDPASTPAAVRTYLTEAEAELAAAGFTSPTRGTNTPQTVTTYFTLMERPDGSAIASSALFARDGEVKNGGTFLRSEFEDDSALVTTNVRAERRFPSAPGVHGMTFPAITDAGELAALHDFRVAEHALGTPMRPVERGADPLAYQRKEGADFCHRMEAAGYYRRIGAGQYTMTARGAAFACWRGLFPWADLLEARAARERAAVLARRAAVGDRHARDGGRDGGRDGAAARR